jgi:hypothetical protein
METLAKYCIAAVVVFVGGDALELLRTVGTTATVVALPLDGAGAAPVVVGVRLVRLRMFECGRALAIGRGVGPGDGGGAKVAIGNRVLLLLDWLGVVLGRSDGTSL